MGLFSKKEPEVGTYIGPPQSDFSIGHAKQIENLQDQVRSLQGLLIDRTTVKVSGEPVDIRAVIQILADAHVLTMVPPAPPHLELAKPKTVGADLIRTEMGMAAENMW